MKRLKRIEIRKQSYDGLETFISNVENFLKEIPKEDILSCQEINFYINTYVIWYWEEE